MSYASLIVDAAPENEAPVRFAFALAQAFGASLTGVCTVATPPMIGDDAFTGGAALTVLMADYELAAQTEVRDAESRFRAFARTANVQADWRGAVGWPPYRLVEQARLADLVVVGAHSRKARYGSASPADVAMSAGRPVLVVPRSVPPSALGGPALVAWKDTREARRAVAGAVPLLQRASRVHLAEVCAKDDQAHAREGLADVQTFLARHGVRSDFEVLSAEDTAAGERLLGHARDSQCDLVVAGAYGHPRLTEWILGGVTRTLIDRSPLCLLLAH